MFAALNVHACFSQLYCRRKRRCTRDASTLLKYKLSSITVVSHVLIGVYLKATRGQIFSSQVQHQCTFQNTHFPELYQSAFLFGEICLKTEIAWCSSSRVFWAGNVFKSLNRRFFSSLPVFKYHACCGLLRTMLGKFGSFQSFLVALRIQSWRNDDRKIDSC